MCFTFWYEEVTVLSRTSTYQLAKNFEGTRLAYCLTLRTCENNEKLKLSSTNKTCTYSSLEMFDLLRPYTVIEKSWFFGW